VQNRRTSTRHSVSIPATLTIGEETFESELTNLSLGGAFVTVPRRLAMETRVRVTFRIPTLETDLVIDAAVRWGGSDGMGIQFDGLRAREVWSLNKFFESL
jgi:hypothetical protein